MEPIKISDRHYQAKTFDNDPRSEPIYYFIQGWLEILIESAVGKNARANPIEKHREGAPATMFDIFRE